jgi:hypothetical protein
MAHFAQIENDIVTQVIVAEQNFINSGAVGDSFNWIQTSYNGKFRGKYASIGDTWDKVNELFIAPQPYSSWELDIYFTWQPPTPYPTDDLMYSWDEDTTSWVETTGEI